jgi:hypothetical protein
MESNSLYPFLNKLVGEYIENESGVMLLPDWTFSKGEKSFYIVPFVESPVTDLNKFNNGSFVIFEKLGNNPDEDISRGSLFVKNNNGVLTVTGESEYFDFNPDYIFKYEDGGEIEDDDFEDEEDFEPDDNDCFISDNVRGGYDVSCSEEHIGNFEDFDLAVEAVKKWQKENNWFPNVWFVNERGSIDIVDIHSAEGLDEYAGGGYMKARKYARGGGMGIREQLEKELRKLQRDLNSPRLMSYREGDNSEEEQARQRERAAKMERFNEVLSLLREYDSKNYARGGGFDQYGNPYGFETSEFEEREYYIEEFLKGKKYPLSDKDIREISKETGYSAGDIIYVSQKMHGDIQYNPKYARGGMIRPIEKDKEYRYMGSSSIEKDIMDKIRPQLSGLEFAGNFYAKGWQKSGDGYLYFLDEYDKEFTKDVRLNPGEKLFRYYTRTTAIGGMVPLLKINLNNGLIYFMESKDFGDETIDFSTKGIKAEYINLVSSALEDEYALGGGIDEKYPFEHQGIRYNVTDTNGMVNDRGQHLFKIDIEGHGDYTERAATLDLAKMYARADINKIIKDENKFARGGGIETAESRINELYRKSGFINDDFNWRLKLLEMIQDGSVEAYHIYQSLSDAEKDEVLQEQFEMDNDMGMYGDEDIETSRENIEIMLNDAKNGKMYAKGGEMADGGEMPDYTKTMGLVKVKFKNPKYNYSTNVSGDITEAEARRYFVGKKFDVGKYPRENMQVVEDIEFFPKGTYDDTMADGGEMGDNNPYQGNPYRMLDRLRSDNDYFLGYGNRHEKHLWAGSVDEQINEMKRIWNGLKVKPDWLSMEDILEYEKKMKSQYANGGEMGFPPKGELRNSDGFLLKYEKKNGEYEFYVYKPVTDDISAHSRTRHICVNADCPSKMTYIQFINYLYAETYLDDKRYDNGGEMGRDRMEVAKTIYAQLGRLTLAMLGATNFVGDVNSLSFRIKGSKKVNYIKIILTPMDVYTVEFGKIRKVDPMAAISMSEDEYMNASYKVVNKVENVYFDDLHSVIENNTGLYTKFAKGGELCGCKH